MRVLIACEESQTICKVMRDLGHEAYSNDVIDCSGGHPEWHLKMDCFDAVKLMDWDLIIMHPPCTALAVSGNAHYGTGQRYYQHRIDAVEWTQKLWDLATSVCDRVAMENPIGVLNKMGNFPKPQYIQPYDFGEDASKKTGLWLHNLKPLIPTSYFPPRIVEYPVGSGKMVKRWSNQTDSGQNNLPPSEDRAAKRSVTYAGIAIAIGNQWAGIA